MWQHETFAYADSWDTERKRYLGLKAGQQITVTLNNHAVLVKSEVAAAQLAADAEAAAKSAPAAATMTYNGTATNTASGVSERSGSATVEPSLIHMMPVEPDIPARTAPPVVVRTGEPQFHRFHGSVSINSRMVSIEAGRIMNEVINHLTTILGADVRVTLEIQADIPGGVSEETFRTVTENCHTLKFDDCGFEEE